MDAVTVLGDVVLAGLIVLLIIMVVVWFRRDRGESEEY